MVDLAVIAALHHAKTYDDLSYLVEMIREGNKSITEDKGIRNFIADRLGGKPLRGRGKKPANQEKEKRDEWVARNVAIYVCQGLPLYHSEGSESYGNVSAFSKIIELSKERGYSYLKNQKTIEAALKRYFQKGMTLTIFFACAKDPIAMAHIESMALENTDSIAVEDTKKFIDALRGELNRKLKKYLPEEKEPKK